jgi:hypothetical protein
MITTPDVSVNKFFIFVPAWSGIFHKRGCSARRAMTLKVLFGGSEDQLREVLIADCL